MSAEILRQALYVARIGLGLVYPTKHGSKQPKFYRPNCIRALHGIYTPECKKLRHVHATHDPDVIGDWERRGLLDYGYGIIPLPGIIALDCDVPKAEGDPDGRETFAKFAADYGLPTTATTATPSGGRHYWYRLPDGIELRGRADILDAVDLVAWDWQRAKGSPWQAAGPGSGHPKYDDRPYLWQNGLHPEDVGISELPIKAANQLVWRLNPVPAREYRERAPRPRVTPIRPTTQRRRDGLVKPELHPNERNGSLWQTACSMAEDMATDAEIRAAVAQAIEERVVSPDGQYRGPHADKVVRDCVKYARQKYPLTATRRTIRAYRDAALTSPWFKGVAGTTDRTMLLSLLRWFYRENAQALNISQRTAWLAPGDAGSASRATAAAALRRLSGGKGRDGKPIYPRPWLLPVDGNQGYRPRHDYVARDDGIAVVEATGRHARPTGRRYQLPDADEVNVYNLRPDLQPTAGRGGLAAVNLAYAHTHSELFTRHAIAQARGKHPRSLGPNVAHVLAVLTTRASWRNCAEIAAAAARSVAVVRRSLHVLKHLYCCDGLRHFEDQGRRRGLVCLQARGKPADGLVRQRAERGAGHLGIEVVADRAELLRILDELADSRGATSKANRRRDVVADERAKYHGRLDEYRQAREQAADVGVSVASIEAMQREAVRRTGDPAALPVTVREVATRRELPWLPAADPTTWALSMPDDAGTRRLLAFIVAARAAPGSPLRAAA